MRTPLLLAGVAMPVIYFATQIAALFLNPGFDLVRQEPSELGMASAHVPLIANAGFIGAGLGAILAGAGLVLGLRALGGNLILAALAGLSLALFGVAMTMSGLFPLPNPLHYAFGLYPAGLLAPLFGALAFKNGGGARIVVFVGFLLCLALALCRILGANTLVTVENEGAFSRALSVVAFGSFAYLCWAVNARLKAAS
jgi:hypothetical protein